MLATNILTEHARSRSLGRAIAEDVIECVLSFGSPRRRHKAEVYTLNPGQRAELLSELGPETIPPHREKTQNLRCRVGLRSGDHRRLPHKTNSISVSRRQI